MVTRQDYARLINLMLGNRGPNPYMGLGLRGRVGDWWNNLSQQYLPQAPGMQHTMFQALDETDPAVWQLRDKLGY